MIRFFKRISKIFTRSIDNNISYNELLEMIKKTQNIKIIDVRSMQEYEEGHLNGAICIPLYELRRNISEKIQDKNTVIIVYCASGTRSEKGKEILEKLGYNNVYNLKNGIENM